MSVNYTALTIGPIYDTMLLTSSPAGLWCASALFSWIARDLIQNLLTDIKDTAFVSPCFWTDAQCRITLSRREEMAVCARMQDAGVGLFHDRVIFCSEGIRDPLALVRRAKEQTIRTLAEALPGEDGENQEWLEGYLRIYALNRDVPDGESPILYLGRLVSAMELEPRFRSRETANRLFTLFENAGPAPEVKSGQSRSRLIKSFFLRKNPDDRWILAGKGDNIRDLKDIAAGAAAARDDRPPKYLQYYAVLKSDGDSMGKALSTLRDLDAMRDFSAKCLLFCASASELIQNYGGVPLYAGGDDLLALLPVMGRHPDSRERECTIFALVNRLRQVFNECFQDYRKRFDGKPTISFGVSIQYVKSPLYEALEQAGALLEQAKTGLSETAEQDGGWQKNACFLNLRKHSGQSLLVAEQRMDRYDGRGDSSNLFDRLDRLLRSCSDSPEHDLSFLSGAGYQIELFRPLFYQAVNEPERQARERMLSNLFRNLFDNADQTAYQTYLTQLRDLTAQLSAQAQEDDGKIEAEQVMDQIQSAIRLLHFMKEKGVEEA